MPNKWAVFISGRGSNAQAVLDLAEELDVVLCVSSKKSAAGLLRTRRIGIPSLVLEKQVNWNHLHQELKKRKITHIFLLGFMKLLPAEFVEKWQGRIYNVHPSLLPKYPGLNSIERSFEDSQDMGVSVHEVVAEMDAGPLVCQRTTLKSSLAGRHTLTLSEAQFLISVTEQRLVRSAALKINQRSTNAIENLIRKNGC